MDFKDYVKKYNPIILKEFELHEKGWEVLKVGMKLRTLRAGFSGGEGEIRIITELGVDGWSEFAKLSGVNCKTSILYRKYEEERNELPWWKSVEIVEE